MLRRILPVLAALALVAPASALGSNVAGVGFNFHWELGAGYRSNFESLVVPTVGLPPNVQSISAGDSANLALLDDGTIRCWGGNKYGQCGDGVRLTATSPVSVHLTGVVQAKQAAAHGIALKSDGTVWVWGSSIWGQEGNGLTCHGLEFPRCDLVNPTQVKGITGAVAVYAGGADDMAQLADGTVLGWGIDNYGQLGDGSLLEKDTPVVVKGVTAPRQVSIGGISDKNGHTLFLLNDGTVLGVGADSHGQLGDGTQRKSVLVPVPAKLSGVASVSTSVSHSFALLNDGTVDAFGTNTDGELGASTTEVCTKGTSSVPCSTVPVPVPGLANVTQVVAGFRFSNVVTEGHALAWGDNQYGQLGNGTRVSNPTPALVSGLTGVQQVASGEHHTIFLFTDAEPSPVIAITEGVGSLTVSWRSTDTTERFLVAWRQITKPASKWEPSVKVPATGRSYTVTGLTAGVAYEVKVGNKSFGSRVVEGTPR